LNNLIDLAHFSRLISVASGHAVDPDDSETLVGAFQKFRPSGKSLEKVFERAPCGEAIMERLLKVYETTGEARRSDGMSDAFFIVRNPAKIDPSEALTIAKDFFGQLHQLALENNVAELNSVLNPLPTIRIIEGKAPKHPKADLEKSALLQFREIRTAKSPKGICPVPESSTLFCGLRSVPSRLSLVAACCRMFGS